MNYKYDFTNSLPSTAPGVSYWINEYPLVLAFLQTLPTRVADLLDVALAIYAADRRSRRNFKGSNTGQRQILVKVGVRNPEIWTEINMANKLQEFLYWLSEDVWSFQFVRRSAAPNFAETDQFLFRLPPERPVTVSLFSGGLDSLAGLATHMRDNQSNSHLLVSGYTHNRLAERQRLQFKHIQHAALGSDLQSAKLKIHHVPVHFGLHKLRGQQEEKGQRTRGVVFLALGAAVAAQAETDTLWVYENGIGALNLPLNETQLGVDNYRGVHPRSLMMAESLFELALEQPLRIRNPFLFHTKAEMCKALKRAGLVDAIQHTVSCDSFPLRIPGKPSQCGYCTSCVLRRQSLLMAGFEEYDSGDLYWYDVLSRKRDVDPKRLFEIEVMKEQVYKLARCLDSEDSWYMLTISFPELLRTYTELVERYNLDAVEIRDGFVQLYRTYVEEWKSLPGVL
ncbi:MAG: 7-cyano-7-deazaguanine synthase [Caldilineaceae bacterium]|nr:7-cyano-7-deazaguanine synthase [Caldilineaceae bacterium]